MIQKVTNELKHKVARLIGCEVSDIAVIVFEENVITVYTKTYGDERTLPYGKLNETES